MSTPQQHSSALDLQSLAQTAMTQAAHYGSAMQLMANLNQCHCEQSLAVTVLEYLQKDNIHGLIQLRKNGEYHTFDIQGSVKNQIEIQVFELLKDRGRTYHFGKRSIFNAPHVSILVKNMPASGSTLYDSLLDVLAKLIPAIDARYLAISDHQTLLSAKDSLGSVMRELAIGLRAMKADKKKLLESLELQIGLSFHELSLDEAQEQYFVDLIETELVQRNSSEHFDRLQNMISNCFEQITQELSESEQTGTEIEADAGIELF